MPALNVIIDQGELKGLSNTTRDGFQYNSYSGIPYAKPPVGDLRFKDPLPADGWEGVRDASKEGAVNSQIDKLIFQKFIGDEDSLFLNVYAPSDIPAGTKLPVMFWIHGGAFQNGFGDRIVYGPEYLIQKNIILVTINYRLGVLGFLSLNNVDAPGNAGLKDQVMALKWVQKNIEKFGGDGENVTIFGESAGSASVHLLMLSPMAKGLFHKAIMQSGCCLNNWSLQAFPEETAFTLSEKMGLKSTNKEEVLAFLKKSTAQELCVAANDGFQLTDKYFFVPVIEKNIPGVEPFITSNPVEIMMSGNYNRVPLIIGFNSQEGALFISKQHMGSADLTQFTKLEDLGLNLESYLPNSLKNADPQMKSAVIEKIKNVYFLPGKHVVEGYIDFMTDICFLLGIFNSTNMFSNVCNPVYYYQFSYKGNLNLFNNLINYPYKGAAHADDLGYMFSIDAEKILKMTNKEAMSTEIKVEKSDILIVKRIVDMWTNFAKSGIPILEINEFFSCKWEPFLTNQPNCLNIDVNLSMSVNPCRERLLFWKELMKQ